MAETALPVTAKTLAKVVGRGTAAEPVAEAMAAVAVKGVLEAMEEKSRSHCPSTSTDHYQTFSFQADGAALGEEEEWEDLEVVPVSRGTLAKAQQAVAAKRRPMVVPTLLALAQPLVILEVPDHLAHRVPMAPLQVSRIEQP